MYELGMSASEKREPTFDRTPGEPIQQLHSFDGHGELLIEEEPLNGFGSLLVKSGVLTLFALSLFAGHQYFYNQNSVQRTADGKPMYDWAGRPLAENSGAELTGGLTPVGGLRNIDLTTTASIKKPAPVTEVENEPTRSSESKIHIVKSGDTLSAIGRSYKISTADIMTLNKIDNPRSIKPGMKLVVSK